MPHTLQAERETCGRLRQRIVLSLAIEESFLAVLASAAEDCRRAGDEAEAGHLSDLVRSHRLEIIERRAVLGAAGIAI